MNKERFERLLSSTRKAVAHAEGKLELRTTALPAKPREINSQEVRHIRETMNVSQSVMAAALNVSTSTVQSWEQGTKKPSGAALKLLSIAEKQPKILFT